MPLLELGPQARFDMAEASPRQWAVLDLRTCRSERLMPHRLAVLVDGEPVKEWVAFDQAAGEVRRLVTVPTECLGVRRFFPVEGGPYRGLTETVRGRVEVEYRWRRDS